MTEILPSYREDACSLGCQSARAEARSLLPLVLAGSTVEAIRELIAVPLQIEHALLAFARAHSEEAHFIERSLNFRFLVAQEFDRLVRECIPVAELPEVDEPESGAAEETYAGAQQ
jgi:hypothetical protein